MKETPFRMGLVCKTPFRMGLVCKRPLSLSVGVWYVRDPIRRGMVCRRPLSEWVWCVGDPFQKGFGMQESEKEVPIVVSLIKMIFSLLSVSRTHKTPML